MITPCRAAAAVFVWALVLSLLAAAINVLHLTPAATATTDLSADAAKRALGVEALGDVRVSHLRELAALSKFTAVYAHLGRRAEYVSMSKLEGKFEARWLPLGGAHTREWSRRLKNRPFSVMNEDDGEELPCTEHVNERSEQ